MKLYILILLFILFYLIYSSYSLEHYFDTHIKLTPLKKKELVQCMNLFNNLCNKNNLYYIISFGTLLGSVRHKGLIPWDDDIDLIMYFDDIDIIKKLLNDFSNKYGYKSR